MGDFSDEELIEHYRLDTGSQRDRFLNQLFSRHHSRVAAWCYRMTGDVDAATDLAQEVFLKAFQNLESFRGRSKFTTWLYSIARNHCMDALKARTAEPVLAGDGALEGLEDVTSSDVLAAMERREAEQLVRQLLRESLDETEAKVMTLHYVHEVPLESVTRMLTLSNASGAKAYVVSARRKLAKAFDRWKQREERRKGGGHAESQAR
jgi:RNA polymerase sigma-70 factor, ECF subfamily